MTTSDLTSDPRFLSLVEGLGEPEPWALKAQRGAALEPDDLEAAGPLPEGAGAWLESFNGAFQPWLANEPKIIDAIIPGIPTPRPLLRRMLRQPDSRALIEAEAGALHSWLALGGAPGPIRLALGYLSAVCGAPVLLLSDQDIEACAERTLAELQALLAARLTERVYSPEGELLTKAPDPQGLTWRYRGPSGAELLVEWHELRGILEEPAPAAGGLPVERPPEPPI